MATYTLVALDTDHIKQYVFATNKLKEIRGASSLLDHLNRDVMDEVAKEYKAELIYANGGSGMFLVPGDKNRAEAFARAIQREYLKQTGDGTTISFGVQEIPDSIQDVWNDPALDPYMRLLHYRLLQNKGISHQEIEVLPAHPFMRPCDACGMRYAEDKYRGKSADPDDPERRYCGVCLRKRKEDHNVRDGIDQLVEKKLGIGNKVINPPFAWKKLIDMLPASYLKPNTIRPSDFNKLEGLSGGRDYMALIYADANQMGTVMDKLKTLKERQTMAEMVDTAIYQAMSQAVVRHLPIVRGENKDEYMFPFDILLIGGDDVMVVTPANVAIDVALTLATEFHEATNKQHTLSIAVIISPIKYPFGLLHELAETTLKRAKKEAAERENKAQERGKREEFDMSTINFVVVAGNTGHDFNKVMEPLSRENKDEGTKFYATLRPYSVEELEELREAIRIGKERDLGHTKLHQLREAVMKKNLTTSVSDARAVLTNWKEKQWQHVYSYVYQVASRYGKQHKIHEKPVSGLPRMRFPWFEDGEGVYRSPLLDFAELYDFIEQKGGNGGTKN
ncbi:MAG TPA: hypothetical protein VFA41_04105 [Ktedonobacteraceae bacterium]|nr:hypothetical protein [Ktedonobacteraceae bacterium]